MNADKMIERLTALDATASIEAVAQALKGYDAVFSIASAESLVAAAQGDMNAAVLVVQAELPGWLWRMASCHLSDDAWVQPDFGHPVHGPRLQAEWPLECQRDPLGYLMTDIDLRPAGRPSIALLIAVLCAIKAVEENRRLGRWGRA